jgi:hypothetical protein
VRATLASLLVLGAVALVIVPTPGSFGVALLVLVAVFLLGTSKLAIDLIELSPRELAADVAVLVCMGVALVQIPAASLALTETLLLAGALTQVLPRALARRMR